MKRFPWDKHEVYKIYRNLGRKNTKRWKRKKTSEKKGFMRYSSGPKWSGQFDYDKPAFWRKWQPELIQKVSQDQILPNGYTKNQTWVALCKSWNGFMYAKREGDRLEMKQYVGQIRKLQKDLGLEQTQFDGSTPEELAETDLGFDEDYLMEWHGTTV